jgi:hypothetical protein
MYLLVVPNWSSPLVLALQAARGGGCRFANISLQSLQQTQVLIVLLVEMPHPRGLASALKGPTLGLALGGRRVFEVESQTSGLDAGVELVAGLEGGGQR